MARRGGFPGGMPGNMTNLMKQAQRMQRQMEEKTKELEEKQYTATAGGGAVSVTVSGKKEVVAVKISPEAVDPDDVEMLEDLIVAATNEAFHQMEAEYSLFSMWLSYSHFSLPSGGSNGSCFQLSTRIFYY